MNAITKNIPNSITCLNLLSGCFACLFAYKGEYDIVALCIGLSALFDFLDGMAARLLHAYSPMGKELDSLADLISFGLAPGFMRTLDANDRTMIGNPNPDLTMQRLRRLLRRRVRE